MYNMIHRITRVVHVVSSNNPDSTLCGGRTSTPNLMPINNTVEITCAKCLAIKHDSGEGRKQQTMKVG